MMGLIEVLDPSGKPTPREGALAHRPDSLRGLRVGLLDNGKGNADVLLGEIERLLRSEHGVERFIRRRKATSTLGATFLDQFGADVDVVANALGD